MKIARASDTRFHLIPSRFATPYAMPEAVTPLFVSAALGLCEEREE
jgi:hypothetical protein